MDEDTFFGSILKQVVQKKDLTILSCNEIILEYFPSVEEYAEKKSKNLFRHLISHKMTKIKSSSLQEILPLLDTLYKKLYNNNATLDNYFSKDIRTPIARRFERNSKEHKLTKKLVKLKKKEKGLLIKKQQNSLINKHKEIEEFIASDIKDIMKGGINSDDPFKVAVVLALACGSRPSELFDKDVGFNVTENGWVKQDFLRKKRGEIVAVTKPIVFLKAEEFIEKLKLMRNNLQNTYEKVFNQDGSLSKTIEDKANKAAKELFNYREDFTLYSCRKLYAQMSYNQYSRNSMYGVYPSEAYWLSQVLGHGSSDKNDLATQLYYSHYKVVNELSETEKLKDDEVVAGGKKMSEYFKIIKEIYYTQESKITQTSLEKLCAGLAPRSVVRMWYQQNIKGKS